MKKVEAIIRSSKFEAVRLALAEIGVNFMTFMEVKGFGKQKGEESYYRGTVYDIGYIARMKLEILVKQSQLDAVINAILESAYSGEVGDGKIIVSDVDRIISIRSKSEGEDAV